MSPFSFLQRGNLADHAKGMSLGQYVPELQLEGLPIGVDNVRVDVFLSPRFADITRQHISRLLARYGTIEDFLIEDSFSSSMRPGIPVAPRSGFVGAPATPTAPAVPGKTTVTGQPKPYDPGDFKKAMSELHVVGLNKAKAGGNISLDLLARLAALKLMRTEMSLQFTQLLEKCRARLKNYEGPRSINPHKAMEMREKFARFQVNKRQILRKAGQEMFSTLREVEKETLSKLRRSLFGEQANATYELFLNRLLFTADGKDDYVNAEYYVMLGNYERDPDKFQTMQDIAVNFVKSLNLVSVTSNGDLDRAIDSMLSVPDNALELFGGGAPDENTPKGKTQRALLSGWVELLENENVKDHVVASYEAVPLLAQY